MTTTIAEKNALLAEAWNLIGSATRNVALPPDDYEDLRVQCAEAANRAIDSWTNEGGRSLPSWIFRHIIQAKRDYFRARNSISETINRDAVCFTDYGRGLDSVPEGDFPSICETATAIGERAAQVQAMEITIDMARNDDVITDREYRVLTMRRNGKLQGEIASELGVSFQTVSLDERTACAKIRLAYRTAE